MAAIFNSRDEACKTPYGALKTGEEMRLSLCVPQSMHCEAPILFLQREGEGPAQYPLAKTGTSADGDTFSVGLSVQTPGLDLWVDYQKLYQGEGGEAVLSRQEGAKFPLVVYDAAWQTPESVHGAVMYQIFPDRFLEGNPQKPLVYNERVYRTDKQNEPYFWDGGQRGGGLTQDYYGGDFAGIQKRLPYLRSIGVKWLYLNPIFEAHANHRYNTADYMHTDPYLGTDEDFKTLCREAERFGIRIILDGVFSHTGSDSRYFNKEGRYPTVGAWQGPQSPYRAWYHFRPDGSYESWWGFDTLPSCNKQNADFRRFIVGEGGVIDHWLQMGAAGFRLDVADELPDDFIVEIRKAVKRNGADKLLIGEVWEDAALKVAYGVRRAYFWGQELDGVMNYPFRTAIVEYLKTGDAPAFREAVTSICEHYPPPALACCTTHLSTHDTERAITALAGDSSEGHDRNWQSTHYLSDAQYHIGIMRMRLAFVLQFTLPGIPCVYYGDEIAMQGYADPFNRGYFDWNSGEDRLLELMIGLSNLRKHCPAGALRFLRAEEKVLAYQRGDGDDKVVVAVNRGSWPAMVDMLGEDVTVPPCGFAIRSAGYKFNSKVV